MRRRVAAAGAVAVLLLAGACAGDDDPGVRPGGPEQGAPSTAEPSSSSRGAPATVAPTSAPTMPRRGAVPPRWLGTRALPVDDDTGFGEVRPTPPELRDRRFTLPDTLPPLPGTGFASRVDPVPPEVLARSTWEPGCPVGARDLRWLRLTFRGFEGARHTGELLVHRTAVKPLTHVFRRLYELRFPVEEMRITRPEEMTAPPTGDGNNTGAFVCRSVRGQTAYSQHAYGLALDLNPFHNPYVDGDLVLPELGSAYLDRSRRRPGMVTEEVVAAFASVGWEWGGAWRSLKDYQHFSANGR